LIIVNFNNNVDSVRSMKKHKNIKIPENFIKTLLLLYKK